MRLLSRVMVVGLVVGAVVGAPRAFQERKIIRTVNTESRKYKTSRNVPRITSRSTLRSVAANTRTTTMRATISPARRTSRISNALTT